MKKQIDRKSNGDKSESSTGARSVTSDSALELIRARAYSVFESRGRQPGHALDHIRSISHGQILNLDLCFVGAHRNQMCNAFVITAKMPSDAIIAEMPVTTARVVASPTAAALAPDCIPRKQPA